MRELEFTLGKPPTTIPIIAYQKTICKTGAGKQEDRAHQGNHRASWKAEEWKSKNKSKSSSESSALLLGPMTKKEKKNSYRVIQGTHGERLH